FGILANPDSWYLQDLSRAAAVLGHKLAQLPFAAMTATLAADGRLSIAAGENQLSDFDAILVRTMPPGSLEQVVFRMDCLGRHEATGGVVINSARAVEAAVDKFLTSAKLAVAGLTTPRTIVCQTAGEALAAFEQLGGDVVLKPIFGSEGRGITRLNDEALAERAFKMLVPMGAVLYIQEFIEHEGFDYRLLLIGDDCLAMRRHNALDWRTNVSRGASAEKFDPPPALIDMARRAANSVGALVAGIDILPARDGRLHVLEVNAVPGWRALARTHDVDVAAMMLTLAAAQAQHRGRA
ncbi:MAG TPA: RimK family alpha-L-glutamate ligase, partial [Pirellulaceae bacterium]|nr:RimK family alpha-L-glutamate ligase [Pirellulaceae bacterium]